MNFSFIDATNLAALISVLDQRYVIGRASNSSFGLVKLYDSTGNNSDGTMTQAAISQKIATAYRFKGSLEYYTDLPVQKEIGDMYNIINADLEANIRAGDNVAWNGSNWDNLAGFIDLSNYLQKNGEYIKAVSFNSETKVLIFELPNKSLVSIEIPSGLGSSDLDENTNFNSLTEIGIYPISNYSVMTNRPVDEEGTLIVFSDKTYTHQLFYTLTGNVFSRVYIIAQSSWNEWTNIKTSAAKILSKSVTINNSDFNNISFAFCSVEDLTSASNYPIKETGMLQTINGTNYTFQTYTANSGKVFNRYKSGNVWSDWKEAVPTTQIVSEGNLNNIIEQNTYHISDSSNAITNKPDNSTNAELTISFSNSSIYQKYIGQDNTIYIRNKKNNVWSDWKTVIDSSSITAYAPLISPAFSGNPTVPDQNISDNSSKIANTKFVKDYSDNALSSYAPLNSPVFSGTPTVDLAIAATDNSKRIASTGFVNSYVSNALSSYAPLNSPALTGTPTATTASDGDNTTRIATTQYVMKAIANLIDSAPTSLNTLNELATALNNDPNFATTVINSIGEKLPLSGGTISGDLSVTGTISGNLSGNASKDSAGQQINSTYLKNISVSGTTLTLTKGDDSTSTISTQDLNSVSKLIAGNSTATQNSAVTSGNAIYLRLFDDSTFRNAIKLQGSNAVVLTSDSSGTVSISANLYAVCSTAGATAAKTVSVSGFTLVEGARITVKFTNENSASNPTLNVNSSGAKSIYYRGYPIPKEAIRENMTLELVYNGTAYEVVGSLIWTE